MNCADGNGCTRLSSDPASSVLHPDGYISVEDDQPGRKSYMKKRHHLEQDPERAKIWRLAWDLLLEDRLTLAEIAEELHARGYPYNSGRHFVQVQANGKRKANYNTMSDIFHNWTYAGWSSMKMKASCPRPCAGIGSRLSRQKNLSVGWRF